VVQGTKGGQLKKKAEQLRRKAHCATFTIRLVWRTSRTVRRSAVRVTRLFRMMLGFARSVVVDVRLNAEERIEVDARPSMRRARCGGCGRKGKRLHGTQGKAREWRHLGMWGRRVIIRARVHRVLCRQCGVRTMEVPWARPGSVFTRVFENEVAWMLQRTDQTTVAR
jgi:transposase